MIELSDKELAEIHASGTTDYGRVTVKMKSEHYAIFRWPGGPWWDNGGRHYGQVSYCLMLKGVARYGKAHPVQEWNGRVRKDVLAEALEEAEANYKEPAPVEPTPATEPYPATPELDRMGNVTKQSQGIGEFIDWLREQGIYLSRYHDHDVCERVNGFTECGMRKDDLEIVRDPVEQTLARFFDIDLTKVENERRAVLDYMRLQQEAK